MINEWITVSKVSQKVNSGREKESTISPYFITQVLKEFLNFSYKKVGFRCAKVFNRNLHVWRIQYAVLFRILDSLGYWLIQIDEFTVGHTFYPSYSWWTKEKDHFVSLGNVDKSYSVISVISKFKLEWASIYSVRTNQNIFIKFIKNMMSEIKANDQQAKSKFILLFEGSAYHKTKKFNDFLKNLESLL